MHFPDAKISSISPKLHLLGKKKPGKLGVNTNSKVKFIFTASPSIKTLLHIAINKICYKSSAYTALKSMKF